MGKIRLLQEVLRQMTKEQIRLLPKGSMIHTLRGEDWHYIKFWYLPRSNGWEVPEKHRMGKCIHCKIWKPIPKEA